MNFTQDDFNYLETALNQMKAKQAILDGSIGDFINGNIN
jgi:hypothetical protein